MSWAAVDLSVMAMLFDRYPIYQAAKAAAAVATSVNISVVVDCILGGASVFSGGLVGFVYPSLEIIYARVEVF